MPKETKKKTVKKSVKKTVKKTKKKPCEYCEYTYQVRYFIAVNRVTKCPTCGRDLE